MANSRTYRDADDADDADDEGEDYDECGSDKYDEGDEEVEDADEDETTVPCPYCRQQIYEDAQRCPNCERYISAEESPSYRKPWWVLVGVAICLYVVFSWFF